MADPLQCRVGRSPGDVVQGLGQQIRGLRLAAGLTQHELGLRSGTSQSAIANIESNQRVPTLFTLVKLAKALGHDLLVVLPCNGGAEDSPVLTSEAV